MTIIVGGSGGSTPLFPTYVSGAANTHIATALGGQSHSLAGSFWTAIDADKTLSQWESTRYNATSNTSQQTMISLSGQSGVLTSILTPVFTNASAVITIIITIDGSVLETIVINSNSATSSRVFVGGAKGWQPGVLPDYSNAYGGDQTDSGYNSTTNILILTSPQSIEEFVAIPFKSSLNVTIQSTIAWDNGGAETLKSFVGYSKITHRGI